MHRHKYSKTKIVTAFLICIIFLTCAPKPFIWQGRYVDISTTELPKEDVKAGNYLIVAYTPNEKAKNSTTPYKFAIMKDTIQIGLFYLEKIPNVGYLFIREYLNKNRELIEDIKKYFISERGSYITLELYRKPLTYEEIKNITISNVGILSRWYLQITVAQETRLKSCLGLMENGMRLLKAMQIALICYPLC